MILTMTAATTTFVPIGHVFNLNDLKIASPPAANPFLLESEIHPTHRIQPQYTLQ